MNITLGLIEYYQDLPVYHDNLHKIGFWVVNFFFAGDPRHVVLQRLS